MELLSFHLCILYVETQQIMLFLCIVSVLQNSYFVNFDLH